MKFGVVIFPGSNCDHDMLHVLSEVMNCQVRELWHKDTDLGDLTDRDCIVLPGGFSYGDYLRAGAIAQFSPIMKEVKEFANRGGHVLGVCNGFQILCESGLLPGALIRNSNQKFICKNVHLRVQTTESKITQNIAEGTVLNIPIAHAEGRYQADAATLQELIHNDQILLKYCNGDGQVDDAYNPNGSLNNIAGICNADRNVFGMMPHPERASENTLGNADGKRLFESLVKEVLVA